jgi:hypothetical protein
MLVAKHKLCTTILASALRFMRALALGVQKRWMMWALISIVASNGVQVMSHPTSTRVRYLPGFPYGHCYRVIVFMLVVQLADQPSLSPEGSEIEICVSPPLRNLDNENDKEHASVMPMMRCAD